MAFAATEPARLRAVSGDELAEHNAREARESVESELTIPESAASACSASALVVDLDGTLTPSNLLLECILAYLKKTPLAIVHIAIWLLSGRAVLKRKLAERVTLDVSALPLNRDIEAYAAAEKRKGRGVYLATGADETLARSVAARCGFFDGVFASDGRLNLKGRRKQDALCRRFPEGYAYAGDSRADLPVWSRAAEVIVVGRERWAGRIARRYARPWRVFSRPSILSALIESARPHQWAKNALVFVPMVLGGALSNVDSIISVLIAFSALCILASTTYVINDLLDIDNDRRHWSKCKRPIPSGRLPLAFALAVVPLGIGAGLIWPLLAIPIAATAVLTVYLAITLAYSFALKRIPILDVTVLASLYTLRLVLGIVAAGVVASPWLLVFSMFQFASLCFAKRYVEAERAGRHGSPSIENRGYSTADSLLLLMLGVSAGIASVLIMVLYIMFDAYQQTFYGNTAWLWVFPIVLFLWNSRVWLIATRGELDDDPVAFAVRDKPSVLLGAATMIAFLLAWTGSLT